MSKINERQLALRTGGNYTLLKDFMDGIKVKPMPMNETQVVTGLSADTGVVIPSSLIPANVNIPDNTNISSGALSTAANEGGIVTAEGVNFTVAGTFAHDTEILQDAYLNILNAVQVRYAASHDPIYDTDGREVFGLIQRLATLADDSAVAANPNENLQISFVVNDGTGTLAAPAGGVTGDIEFNFNRAFARRHEATVALEGGNNVDLDIIVDLTEPRYSTYTVTSAFASGETLTLSTGAGSVAGASTRGGDTSAISLNADAATFNADNTAMVLLNGVEGIKGTVASGDDFEWVSTDEIKILTAMDVDDILIVKRRY